MFGSAAVVGFTLPDVNSVKVAGEERQKSKQEKESLTTKRSETSSFQAYYRQTHAGNYLSGYYAQYHQDWKSASEYLDRVLDHDPDNKELLNRAMLLAIGSGNGQRAIALARKAQNNNPDNAMAALLLTMDALQRQDYTQAVDILEAMPENGITEYIQPLLVSWAKTADYELSLDNLHASLLHTSHALLMAEFLGQYDEEMISLPQALQAQASYFELERLGNIFYRLGENEKAMDYYESAQTIYPSNQNLQEKITRLEDDQSISDLIDEAPVQTPEEGAALAMMDVARILINERSQDSAVIFTRMALHLNPNLTDGHILLAGVMTRAEQYDEAIAQYQKVPPESDLYIDAQRNAADLMERAGRTDDAISLLEKLYKENADVDSLILIGDIHRRQENFDQSIKAYNRAAATFDNGVPEEYWHLLYVRGMALERIGDWEKSEQDLVKALEYNPDYPYLLNYLGYSWADQGVNLDKALDYIEQAANLRPNDGYIADSLGWVLYRMDKFEQAVPHLEKAVKLMPYDPVINDHLGDAYWQVGRKLEARFQWRRALNHAEEEDLKAEIETKLVSGLETPEEPAVMEAKTSEELQTAP